jgi:hypothetical protein
MKYNKEEIKPHNNELDIRNDSFSTEDMINAFNSGGKHIYECEANGKDKKCYCKSDNDCNHRHYISAIAWLKNYR